MSKPKVAIMLEDNQQTNKDTKFYALQTNWITVKSWTDIETEICKAWDKIYASYPSYSHLKMKYPVTLALRVGIETKEGRTFSRLNYTDSNRQKRIRVYNPKNDERHNMFFMQVAVREEIREIKGFSNDPINPEDNLLLLEQFSMVKKDQDLPLFSSNMNYEMQDDLLGACGNYSLF